MTAFGMPGIWEIAIIGGIAALIFGPWFIRRAFSSAKEVAKCGREMKRELEELGKEVGK